VPLYPGMPSIDAYGYVNKEGVHMTRVTRNGKIIKEEPTPPEQIKPKESCHLWKYGDDGIKDKTFKKITRKK